MALVTLSHMSTTGETPPRVSQLAWAAFICAVVFCIPLLGVVAIALGSFALGRIRNSQGTIGGRRIALVAMGIGAATSIGWIIGLDQFQSWYRTEMNARITNTFTLALDGAEAGDVDLVRAQFTSNADGISDDAIVAFGTTLKERWGRLLGVTIVRSLPQGDPLVPRMAVTFELEFEHANPTGAATFALLTSIGSVLHEPHLVELEIFEAEQSTLRLAPG